MWEEKKAPEREVRGRMHLSSRRGNPTMPVQNRGARNYPVLSWRPGGYSAKNNGLIKKTAPPTSWRGHRLMAI